MHADITLLATSPAVQSLLKVTCVCGGEGTTPPSPPHHLTKATCHASQAVQHRRREEGVGWGWGGVEREGKRTHRKTECVCSKFWVICLVRFLDLGKDVCRNKICIRTPNK